MGPIGLIEGENEREAGVAIPSHQVVKGLQSVLEICLASLVVQLIPFDV